MNRRDRLEITDPQTGEFVVIECADVAQLIQSIKGTAKALDRAALGLGKSKKDEFIQMNQANLKSSSANPEMSGCDLQIWQYCCGDAGYGGKIKSTQAEIGKALDITPSRVNRAFKRLKESKMIEPAGSEKGTPTFKVSALYGIKGKREVNGTDDMAQVIRFDLARDKKLKTA